MKIGKYEVKIGADPELFVYSVKENRFVSAHGLIPGDKQEPHKVDGGAIQVDGLAVEYNVDPQTTTRGFGGINITVLQELQKALGKDYVMVNTPAAFFGDDYLDQQPKDALILGCEPDYNAYTGKANVAPNPKLPYRTGSGHIHIGWTNGMDPHDPGHFMACRMLAATLDGYLGLPSLGWSNLKLEHKRRSMYGKMGAFRPKPFGMEYRTPSNAWVGSKDLMEEVGVRAFAAFGALLRDTDLCDKVLRDAYYRDLEEEFDDMDQPLLNRITSYDSSGGSPWADRHGRKAEDTYSVSSLYKKKHIFKYDGEFVSRG